MPSKPPKGKETQDQDSEPVAFDDALRRLVSTPPKHRKGGEPKPAPKSKGD